MIVLEPDDVGRSFLTLVGHGFDSLEYFVYENLIDEAQFFVHVFFDWLLFGGERNKNLLLRPKKNFFEEN